MTNLGRGNVYIKQNGVWFGIAGNIQEFAINFNRDYKILTHWMLKM